MNSSFFIMIFITIFIYHNAYGARTKTLIDFTKYEESNKKDKYLYKNENDNIRQNIYNKSLIPQSNEFNVKNRLIPKLEITPNDISLNKWLIKLIYPKELSSPIPALSKRRQSPYSKHKNINKTLLGVPINFSNIYDSTYAIISPGFRLYEFDKRGKLTNIGNGVLDNVGDIEKLFVTIGFIGKPNNNLLYLRLRDYNGNLVEYPVGFIYKKQNRNYKYFREYDGKNFSDEIQNMDSFIKNNKQKNIYFYKVYYKNAKVSLWTMYKNNSPIYNETILEWTNSKYLPTKRKNLKRQELYPKEIPYIKFDSFMIEKKDGTMGNKFYLLIKNVKIKYDLAIPDYYLDIDDEDVWSGGILRRKRIIKRKKLEIINAIKIYNMIKLSWKKGFIKTKDGYNNFKKHYNYFLRYNSR